MALVMILNITLHIETGRNSLGTFSFFILELESCRPLSPPKVPYFPVSHQGAFQFLYFLHLAMFIRHSIEES